MASYRYETTIRDQIEIVVYYEVIDWGTPESGRYGPPEFYDCGSAPEIQINLVFNSDTDEELELSNEELAALEEEILEDVPLEDAGPDPDEMFNAYCGWDR